MRKTVAALGVGTVAVVCCAAVPLVVAGVGGLTLAAVFGWGALIVAAIGVVAVLVSVVIGRHRSTVRIGNEPVCSTSDLDWPMKVELLYFDGCPSYEALLPKLGELLADEGAETEIELRRVESVDAAEQERFLGSPTVRVDGEDVDPGAGARTDFGLKCRLYRSNEGTSGLPPEGWIIEAIRGRIQPTL